MQQRKLHETKSHYEQYPFIEGGPPRIAWWQEYLADFLPDDLVRNRLIADVGSSVGEIARGLANRGARMVCLDLTLAALRRNHEINPEAELFNGSAIDLPFADETFDHSISIGVLMVTPDCRKGFREVARVTAPGGTVVLFIYNYWCYLNLLYKVFAPVRRRIPLEAVPSAVVRMMQPFVKSHLGTRLAEPQLRRLLGDKLWTPHATFHTLSEMRRWGEEEGLTMVKWKRFYHHYANVMAFRKRGTMGEQPRERAELRCLQCGRVPLQRSASDSTCAGCGARFPKIDGIHRFLATDA